MFWAASPQAVAPNKHQAVVNLLGGLAQAMAPSKYQAVAKLLGSQKPTCAIVFCDPPPSLVDNVVLAKQP